MRAADWVVVIPVKRLAAAKSRLRGAVAAARHEDLATAMLRDTVAAALACPEVADVLVVTDDPATVAAVVPLGARAVPDEPAGGLNAAVGFGADRVAGLTRCRAALTGDLPGLRADELAAALRLARGGAGRRRHFVPDADGTGTVLLTAPAGVRLQPHFGTGSAAAHAASGAVELTGDWPGLRQDVDTPADLRAVLALGAGRHTAALVSALPGTPGRLAG